MKQGLFFSRLILVLLCGVFLSGCEMALSSRMNTAKIEVRSKMKTHTLDAARPNSGEVESIASDFNRRGEGLLKILVIYDPICCMSMDALKQGNALRDSFIRAGVKNDSMTVGVISAREDTARGQTIVTYHALEASLPQGCDSEVPGSEGAVSENDLYQYGCGTADLVSRQIAHPGDLLGREAPEVEGTARRQAGVVEPYNTGEPFEPLKGLQASGLGESQ